MTADARIDAPPRTDHPVEDAPWPTLPGRDYHAAEVFEREREQVFSRDWYCIGRSSSLDGPGAYASVEVAGEPLIWIRDEAGTARAFANTCRHRGTRLLDGEGRLNRAIKCPYHAWVYGFDGRLLGSPNVRPEDGIDPARMGLWEVRLEEWDGFSFVNLDGQAPTLEVELSQQPDSPMQLARYRVGELAVGARRTYDVAANWKIVVENYHECLHCPTVHPELVKIVPLYRTGEVEEEGQVLGNSMGGLTSFTATGTSSLPALPGLDDVDVHTFYGVYVFPNLILNYHSETVNAVTIHPLGPDRSTVVSEFLFAPETVAVDGFDPTEVVEFRDLVARQDWSVCERAQQGVRSRYFTNGWYPRQERWIASFNERYLAARDRP
jgi:Rieske 2Fe-2S family protein